MSNKIIGNGMIAKKFKNIEFHDKVLIFASGVSDSQAKKREAFERESMLLHQTILNHSKHTIVYFSTCSINQIKQTPYIKHKLSMEKKLENYADSYYIFRLPQVVGETQNSTLVSFFTQSIIERKKISLQQYAKRNLLDVDDLVRITKQLISKKVPRNNIYNIASGQNIFAIDIFNQISEILNIPGLFECIQTGDSHDINTDYLSKIIDSNDKIYSQYYWKDTLTKYVPILSKKLLNNEE